MGEATQVNPNAFLQLAVKSRLVEREQLQDTLIQIKNEAAGQSIADVTFLSEKFTEKGLLTNWQCEKLAEGRSEGFFLNEYKLLDHLGTGGMSSVYLAEHVPMQRRVAVKVLPKKFAEDASCVAEFRHEISAVVALFHENVVRAYDVDNAGDTHYMVMEYVEGFNLEEIVERAGPLHYPVLADYIRQAVEGLHYAHEAGLIHDNLKPTHLLVDRANRLKVLDLGWSQFTEWGTADYMAPERAIDRQDIDARADIYSLGCTMFFLFTGRPPFGEGTLQQRLAGHQKQPAPDISEQRPDAPKDLIAICLKMMAKKPEDRFQTAGEVAQTLRAWLEDGGDGAGARVPNPTRPPTLNDYAGPDH